MDCEFYRTVLENGLTVVGEKTPSFNTLSIGLWVKVGSLDESTKQSGMAHFIEHMVFKGSAHRTAYQIATALESVGGDLNAFTEREFTCFHATVLKQYLGLAIDVLSDMVMSPLFLQEDIQKEKQVLFQEMAMAEDNPEEQVMHAFYESVFSKQAMGRSVLGNKKSILGLTRSMLLHFYNTYYQPDNMVVSVAGDFNWEELKQLCLKNFQSKSQSTLLFKNINDYKYHARKKFFTFDCEQTHALIGFETFGFKNKKKYAALLLTTYLGGGMSSRLFQTIREKEGLAYQVDSDLIVHSHLGILFIYAAFKPALVARCLSAIGSEIKKIIRHGIDKEEMKLVKGQIKGTILLSSEQMDFRQEYLARSEIFSETFVPISKLIETIEQATEDEMKEVAEEFFVPSKQTVIVLGPKKVNNSQLTVL